MQLRESLDDIFLQLTGSITKISREDYVKSCSNLGGATIGQHVRHIIEMFLCLENGYASGMVNYENRKRDRDLEENILMALTALKDIQDRLFKPDKPLIIEGTYNRNTSDNMQIPTYYSREILYNLEHTIHHMALIRVGITELTRMELPDNFGVASSTVKHRRSCAQ